MRVWGTFFPRKRGCMASRKKDFDDWVWELADRMENGIWRGVIEPFDRFLNDFLYDKVTGRIDRVVEKTYPQKDDRAGTVLSAVPGILKKGDVIFARRLVYRHYGVYAGKNRVIHYARKESRVRPKITIEETSLADFSRGDPVYVIKFPEKTDFMYSPRETVKRAKSRIGKTDYNLVFNNCEHFAYWCKTGKHESSQVQDVCERLFKGRINPDELRDEIAGKVFGFVCAVSDWIEEKIDGVL
jgi:hypothetical protein